MLCRLARTVLLGALCACDAPPQGQEPVAPKAAVKAAPASLSKQWSGELAEQCSKISHERFRRDGQDGAEFRHHYNRKLQTCFYLLTLASAGTLEKMLFDADSGELYGEFLGPAYFESPRDGVPQACRVESFYCASGREWGALAEPYMQD